MASRPYGRRCRPSVGDAMAQAAGNSLVKRLKPMGCHPPKNTSANGLRPFAGVTTNTKAGRPSVAFRSFSLSRNGGASGKPAVSGIGAVTGFPVNTLWPAMATKAPMRLATSGFACVGKILPREIGFCLPVEKPEQFCQRQLRLFGPTGPQRKDRRLRERLYQNASGTTAGNGLAPSGSG
jgi:hypothetical protein